MHAFVSTFLASCAIKRAADDNGGFRSLEENLYVDDCLVPMPSASEVMLADQFFSYISGRARDIIHIDQLEDGKQRPSGLCWCKDSGGFKFEVDPHSAQ